MKYIGKTGEYFEIQSINDSNCQHLTEVQPDTLRAFWFTSHGNVMYIDGIRYTFKKNDIIFLTQFHKVHYEHIETVNLIRFNRPFYCILDHDSEVGCKGVLYFGAARLPLITPTDIDLDVLNTAWKMASLEFEMKDNLQLEMLQMMLKRILILCTRVYKKQYTSQSLTDKQHHLVKEFNYLVESHFRKHHNVATYADMLNRSPKTITNTFKKLGEKSPLQFIRERLILEARRLLSYGDKDISEIAYDLGFNDLQTFSRFFKQSEGQSPSEYRSSKKNHSLEHEF